MMLLSLFCGMSFFSPQKHDDDRQQIIDHIHRIFQAFVDQDSMSIRNLHTEDWTGFQNRSREIVKGVDGYMQNVRKSLAESQMLEYELEDIEVRIYGETAIVFYVGNWKSRIKRTGLVLKFRVRSVDIFRKTGSSWNQTGSHLSILPSPSGGTGPDRLKCFDIQVVEE
jgi:ketosteroid isomerase-like protein